MYSVDVTRLAALAVLLLVATACSGADDPPSSPTVTEEQARARNLPVRTTPETASPEQTERRARSIARLRREGVPVLETLPVIEAAAECRFRTRDEIVDRAVALFVVASRGAGDGDAYAAELATRYETASRYSPAERAYMSGPADAPEGSALSWRFEALRVLLWALGYLESLPAPTEPLDGVVMAEIIRPRTLEQLRADAHLRSPAELLDQADLIYRYAWASTDARVNGQPPPAGLNPDVVMEWHPALNWLIGYGDASWDDVPTDT